MAKKKPAAKKVKKAPSSAQRKAAKPVKKRPAKAAPQKKVVKKPAKQPAQKVARKAASPPPAAPPVEKAPPLTLEARVDVADKELIAKVRERLDLASEQLKGMRQSEAVYQPQSDEVQWARLGELNTDSKLPQTTLRTIFREINSAARARVKVLRVAYLGPAFSFTHLAAIERFGKSADLVPVNTIASVFEEVNRGHADYGIVPIENSTDGRIVDTLDMFTRLPLRICGEVQMAVHHNLLSRSPRSEIVEVYSKPQAMSQCRDWLARNMTHARLIDVTSTSTAAQLARDKPGAAAIASRQAAVQYDLQIIAERIEDNTHNVTRFAVIGEHPTKPTEKDRTALLLQIPHTPGSLSDALQAFKTNKVNLTWIESFPLRGPESGYLFFLDFEGHSDEIRIKKTLASLQEKAVRMDVLGSYPRSEPID